MTEHYTDEGRISNEEAIDILERMSVNHFYGHREMKAMRMGAEALRKIDNVENGIYGVKDGQVYKMRCATPEELFPNAKKYEVNLMVATEEEEMDKWRVGEYIIYVNGDRYELGRIKSLREDGAFVAYHSGETGAKTSFSLMHKLSNAYAIKDTSLGGEYFASINEAEE